ncbi:MAG: formylglycine-generating enzyme family protein [Desulfobulbaceae bacterium]|nr:formylglycine-generating enzyme family protein [Desulfobulbaceae bacterium]
MTESMKLVARLFDFALLIFFLVSIGELSWPGSVYALLPGMVEVKGGCFKMGDAFAEGDGDEYPVHEVCVDTFLIGSYEVTQHEWQTIMGSNPARFQKGDDYPVESISWDEAQEYILRLNRLLGGGYRLPTEAEWEFACRSGGRGERYCGGSDLEDLSRFQGNSSVSTQRVGTRFPNGLGIYDMSGNVWEWVEDWYGKNYYQASPQRNPTGPSAGFFKVSRGGSWDYGPWFSRSSVRLCSWPNEIYFGLGLRLARSPTTGDASNKP